MLFGVVSCFTCYLRCLPQLLFVMVHKIATTAPRATRASRHRLNHHDASTIRHSITPLAVYGGCLRSAHLGRPPLYTLYKRPSTARSTTPKRVKVRVRVRIRVSSPSRGLLVGA